MRIRDGLPAVWLMPNVRCNSATVAFRAVRDDPSNINATANQPTSAATRPAGILMPSGEGDSAAVRFANQRMCPFAPTACDALAPNHALETNSAKHAFGSFGVHGLALSLSFPFDLLFPRPERDMASASRSRGVRAELWSWCCFGRQLRRCDQNVTWKPLAAAQAVKRTVPLTDISDSSRETVRALCVLIF